MGSKSDIEWTDASWTPIRARNLKTGKVGWHCEHATTGCEFCYAETLNKRLGTGLPFKPGHRSDIEIFLDPQMLLAPLKWKKPRMIFVCSMTDLFADFVPDEWIDQVFAVMALCPQHTFQVLTKRAERMRDYMAKMTAQEWWKFRIYDKSAANAAEMAMWPSGARPSVYPAWPLDNVWLGVPTERQKEADERIPLLLQTPAAVRFISAEPLLGPIDLSNIQWAEHRTLNALTGWKGYDERGNGMWYGRLHWVITGGESGPNARPSHPQWFRDIRDACAAAGVAYFHKQNGEWLTVYDRDRDDPDWRRCDVVANETPNGQWLNIEGMQGFHNARVVRVNRVGKKAAGRLLDGITHDDMPPPRRADGS